MMKEFFQVSDLEDVLSYTSRFSPVGTEEAPLQNALNRVLANDLSADESLPGFSRSTMDGYAVRASSTFGASEANPAYFTITGAIGMGEVPDISIGAGEAAKISTGGMLPEGADGVVMVENTAVLDETTIEIYKSVAPGAHVIRMDEDFKKGETVIARGKKLRSPEMGLLAAFGKVRVRVYKKPVIGIVSTGDEIIPVDQTPAPGEIRDTNTYTLSGLIDNSGGSAVSYGIVKDNYDSLYNTVKNALAECDMVLISGGSSVGSRDYTIDVLSGLPDSEIWVHGISISPGKPTILARSGKKAVWGLPGHVVSAIIVYEMVVRPFTDRLSGYARRKTWTIPAILSRNIPSVQGREDFVRVRLKEMEGKITAEPVLGKSGLLHTMIRADGLIRIDKNTEGLDKNTVVRVIPV